MTPVFIDTHCHLDFPEFDIDRDEVIKRAQERGIGYIINIGAHLESSKKSLELAKAHDLIYAVIGIHPHDADAFNESARNSIKSFLKEKKVVAVGEIGLDYYRNLSSVENQKRAFSGLLGLAKDYNLPVVIHCRQAEHDVLGILKDFLPIKAVVHCFSGGPDFLKGCLDKDFFISFTCNITYKKAQGLRDIVKAVPLERIMLETDAPYLSPEGLRGKRNEPCNVKVAAEEIARIKGEQVQRVAEITTNNAKEFFNLK